MAIAGDIKINVTGPYPCWCEVSYQGERMFSLRHDELSDLKYAVEKAMQEARQLLPERERGEV